MLPCCSQPGFRGLTSRSFFDANRKAQFGACYAVSARRVLSSVVPHLIEMRRATRMFEWEAAYRSGIVAIRSSLHVLHKTDAKRSPFLAAAVNTHFLEWKSSTESPFILLDDERNMLLKEGRSAFHREVWESYSGEPRLLAGSQLKVGSEIVQTFTNWALSEIADIEESAFGARRAGGRLTHEPSSPGAIPSGGGMEGLPIQQRKG